jgi:Ankyrin repeats (many copies)
MHMAFEMDNRSKIMAGVAVLALAGAGAWFFYFQNDAPPPRAAAPAKSAVKAANASKAAEAAKPAADDAKPAAAAPSTAPAAPAAAAKPVAAKPIPKDPGLLIAEVIETSGVKVQFQTFGRETMLKAYAGGRAEGASAEDVKAVTEIVERVFEPGKMAAELAANLKSAGNFDAERMTRFLELLRQPISLKMTSQQMRSVTPEAMKEYTENFRKSPPPGARVKVVQAIDEVTHTSEVAADMTNAMARSMIDTLLDGLQKAGKQVPREARQSVGSRLNALRNEMRTQFRTILYVTFRDATDEELSEYLKLLDADTGHWGSELLTNAIRPVLVSRGSQLGREIGQLAVAKQGADKQVVSKAPAPAAAVKEDDKPADKPVAAAAPAPVEQPGYRRPANIRELYTRYNDVISATVMQDRAAVKELLDDGKPPNDRQKDGLTPLMIAASNSNVDIAAMLLAKGANPNARAPGGKSALSIAKSRGAAGLEMVQLLQRSGATD